MGGGPAEGPGGRGGARGPAGGEPGEGPEGEGGEGGDRLGSGHPQKIIQSPNRLYKAPTDYTMPQQTIQKPNILDKTH